MTHADHDPLQPHAHEPNPEPPTAVPDFTLTLPDGRSLTITVADLRAMPGAAVPDCYIVSTGHGASGPFVFHGVTLRRLVEAHAAGPWTEVEVVSGDGFGNRIYREELEEPDPAGPILLAYAVNGRPLTRQEGLVRLIVPSERDDALRQVKWVGEVRVVDGGQ